MFNKIYLTRKLYNKSNRLRSISIQCVSSYHLFACCSFHRLNTFYVTFHFIFPLFLSRSNQAVFSCFESRQFVYSIAFRLHYIGKRMKIEIKKIMRKCSHVDILSEYIWNVFLSFVANWHSILKKWFVACNPLSTQQINKRWPYAYISMLA